MQTIPYTSKEIQQKNGFDEETKLRLKSLLDEINRKQQLSYQNTEQKVKLDTSNFDQIRNARFCYLQVMWMISQNRQKIMGQDSKF